MKRSIIKESHSYQFRIFRISRKDITISIAKAVRSLRRTFRPPVITVLFKIPICDKPAIPVNNENGKSIEHLPIYKSVPLAPVIHIIKIRIRITLTCTTSGIDTIKDRLAGSPDSETGFSSSLTHPKIVGSIRVQSKSLNNIFSKKIFIAVFFCYKWIEKDESLIFQSSIDTTISRSVLLISTVKT